MLSRYMPYAVVDIAFTSGYTTPAASRVWTDVSQWVELDRGISIDVGRQDELSVAGANTLRLVLDNSDGRFTAGRAASPYYPNVKIGRPIRYALVGNLVPNPSFEVDTAGWTGGNATLARSTAQAYVGAASLSLTSIAAGDAHAYTDALPVTPGGTYSAQCRVRSATAARSVVCRILWYDAASAFIDQVDGTSPTTSISAWTQVVNTAAVAPANAAYARVMPRVLATGAASEVHYVDAVMIRPGATVGTYVDGTSAGWTWRGTAHNSQSIRPRFTGFVDQWPTAWDGTDAYAYASITASSRLARLGLGAKLRSMPEQEILADDPAAYWTMAAASGATRADDSSGLLAPAMTAAGSGTAVVFGNATGSPVDGLTAAEFAGTATDPGTAGAATIFGGQYLLATGVPAAQPRALRLSVRLTGLPGTGVHSHLIDADTQPQVAGAVPLYAIVVDSLGRVCINGRTGSSINDNATHDVVLTVNPGVETRLYIDGVDQGTGTVIAASTPTVYRVGQGLAGSVGHVAVHTTAVTTARITAWSTAVLNGFAGERTDERLTRTLGWAGVAAAEVSTDTGVETMTYQKTSGQSVVDALRDVESTESGILYDAPDGRVRFRNRSHRYTAPVAATFDMAAQHGGADYAPKLDRSTLANDVTAENPTTGETARSVDTASSDEYGIATSSARVTANTSDPLFQKASWLVASYAEPRARVPSLTVDVLAHVEGTPSAETVLDLTVSSHIQVTNQPTQAAGTTADYFIEGYTETVGPESYSITYNLSPAHPYLSVLILDDTTRGTLDAGNILGL